MGKEKFEVERIGRYHGVCWWKKAQYRVYIPLDNRNKQVVLERKFKNHHQAIEQAEKLPEKE